MSGKRICICGSRWFKPVPDHPGVVEAVIKDEIRDIVERASEAGDEILVGYDPTTKRPKGVDEWVYEEIQSQGAPHRCFIADWVKFGPRAGHLRNAAMRKVADEVHAFWNGRSKGTANMIFKTDSKRLTLYLWDPYAQTIEMFSKVPCDFSGIGNDGTEE